MNNLLYFKKRQTQQQAHYDLSAKHRVDVDPKSWWKSVAVFWACIFAFGLLMAGLRYATACGDLGEPEPVIIKVVNL